MSLMKDKRERNCVCQYATRGSIVIHTIFVHIIDVPNERYERGTKNPMHKSLMVNRGNYLVI